LFRILASVAPGLTAAAVFVNIPGGGAAGAFGIQKGWGGGGTAPANFLKSHAGGGGGGGMWGSAGGGASCCSICLGEAVQPALLGVGGAELGEVVSPYVLVWHAVQLYAVRSFVQLYVNRAPWPEAPYLLPATAVPNVRA
jgi:hypothetical protein